VSHDLGVVEHVADRVAVMFAGKVVELEPADRLFATPRHEYTQRLLAAVPSLDAVAAR
jgi:ABC-type dipeptide/oligopeptide/nickel transport system ATPase component